MPYETAQALRHRVTILCDKLKETYPEAHCELVFSNPLELLIATILSAQCTDKQVNRVTAELFQRYRTAQDYASAPLEELQHELRSIGLFRNKAKNIQACCQTLVQTHNGTVPASMEALVALAGVGRKTANVVLGNAFGLNHGVVVDTHVARLAGRLKLTRATTPEKIESALQSLVPQPQWTLLSHWLIFHGRRRCGARSPDCPACEISALCPSKVVTAK
ncbi:MAG: endonuclease III [Pedosphaera sp.]|nr:endonuclease III [Pedosphaera sp.]